MTNPSRFWQRVKASVECIQQGLGRETLPPTLVVLGSGFRSFTDVMVSKIEVPYSEIDHFAEPNVEGHGASLVLGRVGGQEVVVLTGRPHLYEGHSPDTVVYPIRVLSTIGVQNIILTNASGSVDPSLRPGSVVVIKDHLNLTGRNCLIGDAQELGPVFVDMGECYSAAWRSELLARDEALTEGIYAGVLGPSYETPAEVAMLRMLGARVVGMSTVQEAIAARQVGLKILGLSFVTNMAGRDESGQLSHEDVIALVAKHQARLQELLTRAIGLA